MAECKPVIRTEVIEHHEGYTMTFSRREAMLIRWLLGLTVNTLFMKKRIAAECKIGFHVARDDCDGMRVALDRAMREAGQDRQSCGLNVWKAGGPPPRG